IFIPLIFSICVFVSLNELDFDHNVSRFEKIVDGSITFTSIVVGFLSALLGVIISIRDAEITKRIFDVREKSLIVYYFLATILLGFLVIVCSGTLYVFIGQTTQASFFIMHLWSVLLFW
ncbi:hypothetical protein, partial [Clostridium perfringens]|uniref:hypothetical protein n=1 Tax=Clostridium perfringens TaxID=1502 RepID=UPI002ACBF339